MASKDTIKIKMESTAGTGYFKTTTKPKSHATKLTLKMYDRIIRKHVEFVEKKVK